jgi:hypothetical protein
LAASALRLATGAAFFSNEFVWNVEAGTVPTRWSQWLSGSFSDLKKSSNVNPSRNSHPHPNDRRAQGALERRLAVTKISIVAKRQKRDFQNISQIEAFR